MRGLKYSLHDIGLCNPTTACRYCRAIRLPCCHSQLTNGLGFPRFRCLFLFEIRGIIFFGVHYFSKNSLKFGACYFYGTLKFAFCRGLAGVILHISVFFSHVCQFCFYRTSVNFHERGTFKIGFSREYNLSDALSYRQPSRSFF